MSEKTLVLSSDAGGAFQKTLADGAEDALSGGISCQSCIMYTASVERSIRPNQL